jgi:gliding motility-associated-like protein
MKKRYVIAIMLLVGLGGFALSFGRHPAAIVKHIEHFDCTALDEKNLILNAPDCNTSNGSIMGLQGSGTGNLVYTWYDADGKIVGNESDLRNVPAGVYKVKLTDDSKCPAATATYILHEYNPISIDNTNTVITSPTCNSVNGSITNVKVNNATKYQWVNVDASTVITTTVDLLNVGPGTYVLTASNAKGCSTYKQYTIAPGSYAPVMVTYHYTASDCKNSGTFSATFDMKPTDPLYTWTITDTLTNKIVFSGGLAYNPKDSARITVPGLPGDGPVYPFAKAGLFFPPGYTEPGLPPGTYKLTTMGGTCFTTLATFTIKQTVFYIDTSQVIIKPDTCGRGTGSVVGLIPVGGPPAINSKYSSDEGQGSFWTDSTGKLVGGLSYLAGVPSGWYTFVMINFDHCASAPLKFFVPRVFSNTSLPVVNDVKLCLPGKVILDVKNRDYKARYRLYDSAQNLIDTNNTGFFIRHVDVTTHFFVVSFNGLCESPPVKVTATVVNPGVNIPNAFTPNNDGINDYWGVTGLDQYPGTEVSVFDRSGQRVYYSLNYSTPFYGRINGRELSTGTYYYIIDTKKPGCTGGISGSVTILR